MLKNQSIDCSAQACVCAAFHPPPTTWFRPRFPIQVPRKMDQRLSLLLPAEDGAAARAALAQQPRRAAVQPVAAAPRVDRGAAATSCTGSGGRHAGGGGVDLDARREGGREGRRVVRAKRVVRRVRRVRRVQPADGPWSVMRAHRVRGAASRARTCWSAENHGEGGREVVLEGTPRGAGVRPLPEAPSRGSAAKSKSIFCSF